MYEQKFFFFFVWIKLTSKKDLDNYIPMKLITNVPKPLYSYIKLIKENESKYKRMKPIAQGVIQIILPKQNYCIPPPTMP